MPRAARLPSLRSLTTLQWAIGLSVLLNGTGASRSVVSGTPV